MNFDWLRHAFAVPSAADFQATAAQQDLVDRLCRLIVERDLRVPALLLLESSLPIHRATAQFVTFFAPLASLGGAGALADEIAVFLEQPGAMEFLADQLENHPGRQSR